MEAPSSKSALLVGLPVTVWLGLALAILVMAAALIVLGINLGYFFFGIVAAALLVPTLGLAEVKLVHRLLITSAVTDGIAIMWLVAVLATPVTLVQWALAYVVLICWAFALSGVSHGLASLLKNSLLASAIVVIANLLWLGWPIWFSQLDWPFLVTSHPLFCLNGILSNFDVWTERPIAYQYLMRLGQDIPYALPNSIVPAAGVHLFVGTVGLVIGRLVGKS